MRYARPCTRAFTDLALSQADSQSIRLYAMSVAILEQRADYYRVLEQTQKGGLDITAWLVWFLDTLNATLDRPSKRSPALWPRAVSGSNTAASR
jgi:Fic family protein